MASNATTGARGITITTYAGTSNAVDMNVRDQSPVITSVSPNSWNAGTTVGVTIGGERGRR
ncbi:MAG TPA: hypothetical protein VH639_16710 [Bryobacteraceae bacterium]